MRCADGYGIEAIPASSRKCSDTLCSDHTTGNPTGNIRPSDEERKNMTALTEKSGRYGLSSEKTSKRKVKK